MQTPGAVCDRIIGQASVAIHPDEILNGPKETIDEMRKRERELDDECDKLKKDVEGKPSCN